MRNLIRGSTYDKKEVDERFAVQREVFSKHAYEMQLRQRVAEERAQSMQATLQTERSKLSHLERALEVKEMHERAMQQAMEEETTTLIQQANARAEQLVQLGKESVAKELSAAHENQMSRASKEQLRLKLEAEELQRKLAELKRGAEAERERNLRELETRRLAVEKAEKDSGGDHESLTFDMSVRGMLKMAEDGLRMMGEELGITEDYDTSARFYYRQLGAINVPLLMHKMGLKPERNPSVTYEVQHWDKGLIDEIEYIPSDDGTEERTYLDLSVDPPEHCKWKGEDVPHFLAREAFVITHGQLCGIREEDEIIHTNRKPFKLTMPNGEDKLITPPPIIIKADWVKYIRKRYSKKKADGILQYLLQCKKEIMKAPRGAQASNYSLPRPLWDKQQNLQATPEQKMALFIRGMNMQHQAQLRHPSAATSQLVCEKFAGKSFDDPDNRLLCWEPGRLGAPPSNGDTTDAQGETTDHAT